eukprot:gene3213-6345_t
MRIIYTILCLAILTFATITAGKLPEVRILIVSLQTGYLNSSSVYFNTRFLTKTWQEHLNYKAKSDPTWPFNATIEVHDCRSDNLYTKTLLDNRFRRSSLPPITVLMGPEYKPLSTSVVRFASAHSIPFVFPYSMNDYPRPAIRNTTFSVIAPGMYINIEVINAYADHGVSSVVAVAMLGFLRNTDVCFGVATYAETKGINFLAQYSLTQSMSRSNLYDIVQEIRDKHKPDAILWCDYYSAFPEFVDRFNPITIFKDLNYLPKALTILDNLDNPGQDKLKAQGLFRYVSSGGFFSDRSTGASYTEGNTAYSSMFRYPKTVNSWIDEVNCGVTTPSSAQLFYAWYKTATGKVPLRQALALWATFDVIEAAIYRAAIDPKVVKSGEITSIDVLSSLRNLRSLTTPSGRIILNQNGDNVYLESIVTQDLSPSESADIVYPLQSRTAAFVYPMPTWDERVYTWDPTADPEALLVAFVCSMVLLIIAVTAIANKTSPEIRVFHYLHIVSLCVAGIICCLCLALVWQKDNTQSQCDAYLWVIGLPASYMIHLVNMKAHRLAVFMESTRNGRRRQVFPHMKVLRHTLYWWMFTVTILVIVTIVDPPVRTRIVFDPYRPKFDEHHCISGTISNALIMFIISVHVIVSLCCVISVRNGVADFSDGTTMKESFLILYIFLAISSILSNLNLHTSQLYVLRCTLLNLGITGFVCRLLFSRCIVYWFPDFLSNYLEKIYGKFIETVHFVVDYLHKGQGILKKSRSKKYFSFSNLDKPFPRHSEAGGEVEIEKDNEVEVDRKISSEDRVDSTDGPIYITEAPDEDCLSEMFTALRDPDRLAIFKEVAKKQMTEDNVEFLLIVMTYNDYCERRLVSQCDAVDGSLCALAEQIYNTHVRDNYEVSLSTQSRMYLETSINEWKTEQTTRTSPIDLIPVENVKNIFRNDEERRIMIFDDVFREIILITYRNLWSKFRSAETLKMILGY